MWYVSAGQERWVGVGSYEAPKSAVGLGKRGGGRALGDGKRCRGVRVALCKECAEAYEIHALREQLKHAKMEVEFYQRGMNLPYNHNIECY